MIDLHTHHDRCGHATGDLESYVRAAIDRGVAILGVSDHAPLFACPGDDPAPGMHMPKSAFEAYLAEADRLRTEYRSRIDLRVGVEADYLPPSEVPDAVGAYAGPLDDPRLDYRLGAVHYFGGYHVYDAARWHEDADPDEVHRSYYLHVAAAAASRRYDVLAHIDAVKARGPAPSRVPTDATDAMVAAIAEAGVAVEINTSGLRKCGEPFPAPALVERLHRAGVPFTFGSDAHAPNEVGYAFRLAVGELGRVGVRELATWRRGERIDVPIDTLLRL